MKFVCEKNALQREITFAQEIISSKSSMSIISNVYLEAADGSLLIRATDIKIGFETRMPVEVQEPGSLTVFCDKMTGILASIPEGTIEVEQKESKIVMKPSFKKAQFSLKTIASEQFPQLPDIDDSKFFAIPLADFRYMIGQTVFAVSDDETRYFMNGVYLERVQDGLVMVATDGKRLAYIKRGIVEGIPEFRGIIIPPKLLSIILHRASDEGQIELAVSDKNLFVKFGQYRLSTVLIEGQFPNYQKVIPESHLYTLRARRQDVMDALKRVSIFVEQKSRRTYFELSTDKLVISSEETEIGTAREEISCSYEGPDAMIAMNYKYIDEPLKALDCDEICLSFTDTSKALTVSPEPESDYFHVLMPMQVD
jgi:DNA polymerase-3 subunit beta